MPMPSLTQEQINLRLAEIYWTPNKIQELADAVMYDSFLDNTIKELFLNWYESKLDYLKEELDEYCNLVLGY